MLKAGFLFIALFVGSYAIPIEQKDTSISLNTDRIVGGQVAGRVPHMVALVFFYTETRRGLYCGGSLITTRHVLTAAHCFVDLFLNNGNIYPNFRAVVGTNNWNSGGTVYRFADGILHPHYDFHGIKNDIGILITATNVILSDTVALTAINYDFIGPDIATTVTGWGKTRFNEIDRPEILFRLNATVVDFHTCSTKIYELQQNAPKVDPNIEICVYRSKDTGMCHGDSGSPLMRADLNQQIGITSWVVPCARGAPDVFVRLSAYRSWIEKTTKLII